MFGGIAMEQKKLFPTAPFGFDKKAVIAYIEQLNQAYEAELQKKEEEIKKLKTKHDFK